MFPLFVVLAASQQSVAAQIDAYVAPYASRSDLSGVVLVRKDDQTIYERCFGDANYELKAPNKPETVFRVASISKTFTAGAIYLLEKRGLLKFEDKLSRYLPDFPRSSEITLLHLLGHTSGVGAPDMEALRNRETNIDEAISLIAKAPFEFEPGAKSSYSNSGYTLLAKVVEKVSGRSFEDFLTTEFFKPLGMKDTGVYRQTDFVPNRSYPYFPGPPPSNVIPVGGFDELAYIGAGAVSSTASDLAKWLVAIRSNRFYEIDKLSWPMGWGKRTYFNKRANEQTGISTGFASGMISFPNEKLEVIVLTNVQTQFAGRAVKDIAGIVLGEKPQVLPAPKLCDISKVDLTIVKGSFKGDETPVLEITERNGSLFYRWDGSPDFRYLAPVGATELYARDEFAQWKWSDKDSFTWSGPYGSFVLKRVKA